GGDDARAANEQVPTGHRVCYTQFVADPDPLGRTPLGRPAFCLTADVCADRRRARHRRRELVRRRLRLSHRRGFR
ncbi:MAG: hypothetical protein KGL53_17150, partial [Elusimicrobia bacterium]|nr:hypothetical protein [Elusimicrobiota bacterium]